MFALKHESRILGHSSNRFDSMLFGSWRTGLALNGTRYIVGSLSQNPTLVILSKDLCRGST